MLPKNQSDLSPNPSPKRGGALKLPCPAPPSLDREGGWGVRSLEQIEMLP
ncbi:hypothetical protein Oscil6304_4676 [Oscillatoria acuminata PCC 6304]|uniref:Uncharacterized protein n=1 Tax=Oscillatoria acuminata PCC 6304 TaxID=56110 RepID=K9TP46_9CYAN|nr:hypothetical protein Oscil6304_4676 [Oscillatoria acuminata PCC 6304]